MSGICVGADFRALEMRGDTARCSVSACDCTWSNGPHRGLESTAAKVLR